VVGATVPRAIMTAFASGEVVAEWRRRISDLRPQATVVPQRTGDPSPHIENRVRPETSQRPAKRLANQGVEQIPRCETRSPEPVEAQALSRSNTPANTEAPLPAAVFPTHRAEARRTTPPRCAGCGGGPAEPRPDQGKTEPLIEADSAHLLAVSTPSARGRPANSMASGDPSRRRADLHNRARLISGGHENRKRRYGRARRTNPLRHVDARAKGQRGHSHS